jgi:hypothetical protein
MSETEKSKMSDQAKADLEDKIAKLNPSSALSLALMLALCHDAATKLTADQRKDILLAGLDAYKATLLFNACQTIMLGEPDPEQMKFRVQYLGARSQQELSATLRKFFTMTDMLKDLEDDEKSEKADASA